MSAHQSRRGRVAAVLVVAAMALAGLTGLALPSSAAAGGGSISGTVRGAGEPVGQVGLYLYAWDGSRWRTIRNTFTGQAGGTYLFDDVDPGTYRVMVSNPDEPWVETFHPSADLLENAADVVVAEGQDVTGKDVDLLREGRIRGTVLDDSEQPLAGVAVTVTDTDQETRYVETETDADGRYEVGGLTTGAYVVLFNGYQAGMGAEYWPNVPTRTLARPVAVVSGEDDDGIDAVLAEPAILRGTVTDDQTGDPVAYAGITLLELRDGDWRSTRYTTGTDARGRYELTGVWGTYRVLAVGPGYDTHGYAYHPGVADVAAADSVTVPEGGTVEDVDVALPRKPDTSTIDGRVVAGGTGAAGIVVTAELRVGEDGWWEAASVTTAADGSYRAYVGYVGTYRVRFTDPSGGFDDQWWRGRSSAASATPLEITRGGTSVTDVDAQLGAVPGGGIGGTVTGGVGELLDEVAVTVYERSTITSSWTEVATVGTNTSGEWAVPDLPVGTYRVGYVDGTDRHVPEFHLDSADVASADDVEVLAGGTTELAASLAPSPPTDPTPSPTPDPAADPTPVPTPTVAPSQPPAPTISTTRRPRIVGQPEVGKVLRVRPGSWSPATVTLTYQWRADGRRVRGATRARLAVTRRLLGARLTVRVRAELDGAADVVATARPTRRVRPRSQARVRQDTTVVWTVSRRLPAGSH